jgi:uncharacterized protein (TIGR02996 family)
MTEEVMDPSEPVARYCRQLASFHAAVLAEPTSDTPRRVFADWLQDQESACDQARGKFILIGIAAAREPLACPLEGPFQTQAKNPSPYSANGQRLIHRCFGAGCGPCQRYLSLARDYSDGLARWGRQWANRDCYLLGIEQWNDPCDQEPTWGVRWERGFVAGVDCTLVDWRLYGAQLLKALPLRNSPAGPGVLFTDVRPEAVPRPGHFWPGYDPAELMVWQTLGWRYRMEDRVQLWGMGASQQGLLQVWQDYQAALFYASNIAVAWAREGCKVRQGTPPHPLTGTIPEEVYAAEDQSRDPTFRHGPDPRRPFQTEERAEQTSFGPMPNERVGQ